MDAYNLAVIRGAQSQTLFTLTDSAGTARDLSGKVASFVVRQRGASTADVCLASDDVDPTDGTVAVTAADGEITVTLHGPTTADVPAALWSLWLDAGADDAELVVSGNLVPVEVAQPCP